MFRIICCVMTSALFFFDLNLKPVLCAKTIKNCDAREALETHRDIFKDLSNFEYYLPDLSCVVCSRQLCSFTEEDCDKSSEWALIPLYEKILEFGLFGTDLPKRTQVSIIYSKTCYHKVKITKRKMRGDLGEHEVYISMEECFISNDECYKMFYSDYMVIETLRKSCFFVAVGYHSPKQVNIDYTTSCYRSPTSNFSTSDKINFQIFQDECVYDESFEPYLIYNFIQDEYRTFDGVPIIVPCSTAGYVVDVKTGRFVTGKLCRKIFHQNSSSNMGLEYIIEKYYDNNENLLFPSRNSTTLTPVYIAELGNLPIERTTMAHQIEINKAAENMVRVHCEFASDESEFTTPKPVLKPFLPKSDVDINSLQRKLKLTDFNDVGFQETDFGTMEAEHFEKGSSSANGSGGGADTSLSAINEVSTRCVFGGILLSVLLEFTICEK